LKENFDRFNFAIYKEKQMADFRRWLTVLAVIAVMAFAASAQVGIATGSAGGPLTCSASAAGTPTLRPEGFTELVGDIIITCTGGGTLAAGQLIPTTNIVVYTTPAVPITSRFLSSNGASEAVLIIDEAGTTELTGATGYGPQAPQTPCSYAQQQALGGTQCPAYVGISNGYEVAVSAAGGTTPAANVYQGKLGDFGSVGNSVAFYNVPILPPATGGVQRVYHITNIRVPVPSYLSPTATLGAFISTSGNQALPLSQTQLNIGVVGNFMKAGVTAPTSFQQCIPQSVQLSANLVFTEGFATGFKTRVVPGGSLNGTATNTNVAWAAEGTNTSPAIQNIPGGNYGGFSQDSESGFIFPALSGTVSGTTYIAGLADYGTRLKAVFTNIPAGLTLYVSTTSATVSANTNTQAAFVAGGTSLYPYAVLVATNGGEATADGSPFKPIAATTQGSDLLGAIALSPNSSGVATAVWEVTNANSGATDVLTFSVYVSYAATSATTTNPYGLPITGLPLGAPVSNAALSYAPEPGGGSFTIGAAQGALPTPRFIISSVQSGPFVSITLCQTTLLYPFVTGAAGFDTGIAIANTSVDPFGTTAETGSCKLYGYGVTVATSGNTASQPVVAGCDGISNPLPGTNCFPIVPAGQVGTVLASATLTNFQGYVIAVCNFQYAHGYAAVTDLGIRNLWSSYLALELNNALGTPRTGVAGIEALIH